MVLCAENLCCTRPEKGTQYIMDLFGVFLMEFGLNIVQIVFLYTFFLTFF